MSDSEDDLSSERQLKLVLLGDVSVGKSSLASRYCKNNFCRQYYPTPGVEFLLKRDVVKNDTNVTVRVWDVGGDARKLLDKYIFNSNIILIVYDVTNEVSFFNVAGWIRAVREACGLQGNPPSIALIGNKIDMEHQRVVKHNRQTKLASELNVMSHFCSARTGEGVALTFQRVLADFLGLKLTRSQAEELQTVVRAEISTHSDLTPVVPAKPIAATSSSSVCVLQ